MSFFISFLPKNGEGLEIVWVDLEAIFLKGKREGYE